MKRHGQTTLVRPFPISVDFRESQGESAGPVSPYVRRTELLKNLGIEASFMGVGVDRIDYTKGIIERFRGVERFLERWPAYVGQFSFVQIGAPSRTHIPRYHDFVAEVEAEALRINTRFQTSKWKPIVLLARHHEHSEILPYYQAADLCMVTSLHDGMNLVAKEFVAAREDEQGALILSRFTGASRELRDALIVNPYDIEQLSDAIRMALEMDATETPSPHAANAAQRERAQRVSLGGKFDYGSVRNSNRRTAARGRSGSLQPTNRKLRRTGCPRTRNPNSSQDCVRPGIFDCCQRLAQETHAARRANNPLSRTTTRTRTITKEPRHAPPSS